MKKILAILGIIFAATIFAVPDRVVIIRHGEKPDPVNAGKYGSYQSLDNLSCKGVHRSIGLISYLQHEFPNGFEEILVPSLTANKQEGITEHSRMFEVIAPYASVVHRDVNSSYSETNFAGIKKEVMKFDKGTSILIVWNHHMIQPLAQKLGISNPPRWKGDDFDSVWVITGLGSGKPVLDTTSYSEKSINPSSACDNF